MSNNAYLSIEEADGIIESSFRRLNEFRVFWSALTDDEKETYLERATEEIDTVSYRGRKKYPNQAHAFPRLGEDELSLTVKKAVCYTALGVLNEEFKACQNKQINSFQTLGAIKNIKYDKRVLGEFNAPEMSVQGKGKGTCPLSSVKAYALLKPYYSGGFRMN